MVIEKINDTKRQQVFCVVKNNAGWPLPTNLFRIMVCFWDRWKYEWRMRLNMDRCKNIINYFANLVAEHASSVV